MKYALIVQAGPEEILQVDAPGDLIFDLARRWPSVDGITVVLPDLEDAAAAAARCREWGFDAFVGDPYNVAQRILDASASRPQQTFSVRVLAIWKHVDFAYVDLLVATLLEEGLDVAAPPRDYDITLAADVATHAALARVASLPGRTQLEERARFNPWGYMEVAGEEAEFRIRHVEPAPAYPPDQVAAILADARNHPENEFFGRDYSGSRYHRLVEQLPGRFRRTLDIACGSGFGSELLLACSDSVVGVDYLEKYLAAARARYPETERLRFLQGDGAAFLLEEGYFDLAVSLHTLEHVPDDRAMLANLHRNLAPGGLLVAEIPLQARRPLGVPINPWHLREYEAQDFIDRVAAAGFSIERVIGSSRSFYGERDQARDALQVWGRRA